MRADDPVEVPVKIDQFPLVGGLDLHTPQLSLKPGIAKDAQNWECSINGGYSRVPGYERFDGRPSPTAAGYGTLAVSATTGLAIGDAINGQTSGATGVVAAIDGLTVVYTKAVGTFVIAENLREAAVVVGVIGTVGVVVASQTTLATYRLAAAAIYRADIAAAAGSGAIRGGFTFAGSNYAWRNNAGATAALLYRASAAGWVAVALPYELAFTAGSGTAPAAGATVTKGAVSAVVRRVILQTGSFAGGTAAGRLIIDAPTGGNFSAGAFTAGIAATCSGAQTQVAFLPGGRFEHDIGNAGNGVRVYGVDGVNRGFEFDGATVCPITTGNAIDTPLHLRVHKNHLFFSFVSSAQHSGIGTPYVWTIVSGAAELAVDQAITGFIVLPGSQDSAAMGILSTDRVSVLYGTSAANWNLVAINAGVGSKAYAAQALNTTYLYDDLGIVALNAVQAYGNFSAASLTVNLRSFVQQRKTLVTDSMVNKEKSQYRVFFSDGAALFMTIVNGKFLGAMPMLFPNPVAVAWSGESTNGGEVSYFGSTNGFVYRMDVGTSFDGAVIDHFCELAFASQGNARAKKRYRRAVFELQGDGYAEFNVGYTVAYGNADVLQGSVSADVTPVYWDNFTWDQFIWDGRAIAPSQIRLGGTAENIAIRMEGSSALWPAFTVNSLAIHYTPRRLLRN